VNLRKYKTSDYAELTQWWKAHSHPVMDESAIPSEGIIVSENGLNVCMGFIYLASNANLAQIAWITTNPELSLRKRYNAVNLFMDGCVSYINSLNVKNVMCFTDSYAMAKMFNRKGFRVGNSHNLCIGSF
jgi:hypothetical protein